MAIIKMKRVFKISLVTVLIMTLVATYSIPTSIAFAGETTTTTEESSVDDQAAGTDPGDTEASNDEGGQKGPETTTDSGITTDPETTTDSGISGEGDENSEDSENPGNPEEPNVPVGPGNDGSQNDEDQLGELQDSLNRQMMMAPRGSGGSITTYPEGGDKRGAQIIQFDGVHSNIIVKADKDGMIALTEVNDGISFACGSGWLEFQANPDKGYAFDKFEIETAVGMNGNEGDFIKPEGESNKLRIEHSYKWHNLGVLNGGIKIVVIAKFKETGIDPENVTEIGNMTYEGLFGNANQAKKITFNSETKAPYESNVVVQAKEGGYVSFTEADYKKFWGTEDPYFGCGTGDLYYTATALEGYEFKGYEYEDTVTGLDKGKPGDYVKPEGNKLNVHHASTLLTHTIFPDKHMHHHGCINPQPLNITVTANFERIEQPAGKTYTVTATAIGNGTVSLDKESGLKQGDRVLLTMTPAPGHKVQTLVVGETPRTIDGNKGGVCTATITMGTSDVTATATFVADDNILYYDANNGTQDKLWEKAAVGNEITVNGNSFENGDYHFTGWNTAKDGSGTPYAARAKYQMTAGEVTLYAQWALTLTHVVVDKKGGKIEIESGKDINNLKNEEHVTLTVVPEVGYEVAPGYPDCKGYSPTTSDNENYTVQMQGKNVIFTVKFVGKQDLATYASGIPGNTRIATQSAACFSDFTILSATECGFEYTGHYFTGWTITTGEGLVQAGATRQMQPGGWHFTAQWAEKPMYSLAYNSNVAAGESVEVPAGGNYAKDTEVTILDQTAARSGYIFIGWNTQADGQGMTPVIGGKIIMEENITLFAQWKALPKVTYHANWDGAAEATTTRSFGLEEKTITLLGSDAFARAGFNLVGWSTTSTGAISGQPGMTYSFPEDTDDIDMYAVWEAIPGTDPEPPAGGNDRPGRGDRTPAQPPAVIEDEGTPLGDAPVVLEEKIIEPEDVPLAELPKTGGMGSMGFLGFGALLAALGIGLKRKEEK